MTTGSGLLTTLVVTPLLGAVAILFIPKAEERQARWISLITSLAALGVALLAMVRFDPSSAAMQLVEKVPWIPAHGIAWGLGVDGLSIGMVLLTALLVPVAALSSFGPVTRSLREFHICLLLLETGMFGVFVATDLVLFYVFWELVLIPMYFLIGVFGGPRRIYASVKFFIYTAVGSVLMLVAILLLHTTRMESAGVASMAIADFVGTPLPLALQLWLFGAFFAAFAVKVPMFPFHTWLPDAHVEAPTAGSVLLAAVLLKMGAYGFLRLALPVLPDATRILAPALCALSVVGIVYGALVALAQDDLKKLVAYSSVSHLGFVTLGIFSLTVEGVSGAVVQMVNHGVSTGALFLLVGVVYDRRHTRLLADFGGLARPMPLFATAFVVVAFSSAGLPGTNGFVGEFLVLVGSFRAHPVLAALSATGVILAAAYLLRAARELLFGPVTHDANRSLPDLNWREIACLAPLVLLVFWIGVRPATFTGPTEASVRALLARVASSSVPAAHQVPASRPPTASSSVSTSVAEAPR